MSAINDDGDGAPLKLSYDNESNTQKYEEDIQRLGSRKSSADLPDMPQQPQHNQLRINGDNSEDIDFQTEIENRQMNQIYNGETQAQNELYENHSESFDEQRQQYTEKAFNTYDYEMLTDKIEVKKEEFKHIGVDIGSGISSIISAKFSESGVETDKIFQHEKKEAAETEDDDEELIPWAKKKLAKNQIRTEKIKRLEEKNSSEKELLLKKRPVAIKLNVKKEGRFGKEYPDKGKSDKLKKGTKNRLNDVRNGKRLKEGGKLKKETEDKLNDVKGEKKLNEGSKFKKETKDKLNDVRSEKRLNDSDKKAFILGFSFSLEPLSEKEYDERLKKQNKADIKKQKYRYEAKRAYRLLFNDDNIEDDEYMAEFKSLAYRASGKSMRTIKKDVRNITDKRHIYKRLRLNDKREGLLNKEEKRLSVERGRILGVNRRILEDDKILESDKADSDKVEKTEKRIAENRKIQQQNRQRRKQKLKHYMEIQRVNVEISFGRTRSQHNINKVTKKENKIIRKRNMTLIMSISSMIGMLVSIIFVVALFLLTFFNIFVSIGTRVTTQNEYITLTDATEYYRKLETDLEERFSDDEKRKELEKEIDDEYYENSGEHIYEFSYDLPEFGFDPITLMAYLSVKFHEFNLEMVKGDLDEIFSLMYDMSWEVKEEERTLEDGTTKDVPICYIKVTKKELEEVVEERMADEELEQYKLYKLSGGGQQTYGPVFDGIDWSNKISSPFGERIHPITKVRTFHDGVDIAVPIGTEIYSVANGTVIAANYSSSAGNMVRIKTEGGWEITFMHMDSISVHSGQQVGRGELLGYTGNTGNSTGPHLHIQVHDNEGNRINPVFIVPQSGNIIYI